MTGHAAHALPEYLGQLASAIGPRPPPIEQRFAPPAARRISAHAADEADGPFRRDDCEPRPDRDAAGAWPRPDGRTRAPDRAAGGGAQQGWRGPAVARGAVGNALGGLPNTSVRAMGDGQLGHGAEGARCHQAMMQAARLAISRIIDGATRDHRRLRLSLLLTASGIAAWVVYRLLT